MREAPYGFCQCGCGQETSLASKTDSAKAHVKGWPLRFVHGHHGRLGPVDYLVDSASGCWVWQRSFLGGGYGKAKRNGRTLRAHRLYYERIKGPVPEGLELDHLCRNRACVNPDHLEPVTAAENRRRGIKTRLTEADAQAIREATGTMSEIGRLFGISASHACQIRKGNKWK